MLTVRAITAHIGAEISGLNAAHTLSASMVAEVLCALDAHGAVLIRGQQLTPDTFLAFSRSLGELAVVPQPNVSHASHAELTLLSNIADENAPIGPTGSGSQWRMDGAHLRTPYRATVLYAVEVPHKDGVPLGDTWLASTRAAHDALDPDLRQQLHGLRATHIRGAGRKKRSTPFFMDTGMTQLFHKGVEHPVIRTHPVTGRKCLYVNPVSTSHLCGLNDLDNDALLAQLMQHMAQPQFAYRHAWQAGDLMIWDNCTTQHRTVTDYAWPQRRLLYRAMVKGTTAR